MNNGHFIRFGSIKFFLNCTQNNSNIIKIMLNYK